MAAGTDDVQLTGTLSWNDLEGGFWSCELDEEHPVCGDRVVLSGFELPAGAADGVRIVVRGTPRPDLVDFLMAGVRFEVHEARVADPA